MLPKKPKFIQGRKKAIKPIIEEINNIIEDNYER